MMGRTVTVKEQTHCGVCGANGIDYLWELPSYPITEAVGDFDPSYPAPDQSLNRCVSCGHVQLGWVLDPTFLYSDHNYAFAPPDSPKYRAEYEFLSEFLMDAVRGDRLGHVLEFGANNLALARTLRASSDSYGVCDPLVGESKTLEGIDRIPLLIEDALKSGFNRQFDLILARHTLEHVSDPLSLLSSLFENLTETGVLAFEVPSFLHLVSKYRFDAITHQHLHYFTSQDAAKLAELTDSRLVLTRYNQRGSNGGSLLFALSRSRGEDTGERSSGVPVPRDLLDESIGRFRSQCQAMRESIDWDPSRTFGFGASLMLATVDYHLAGSLQQLTYVLDDDPGKAGVGYRNVDVRVQSPTDFAGLDAATVVVTSWENSRAIAGRLRSLGVGRVISPLVM